jgi:uncharacterized repeat protein (TIGR02543 family)
MTGSKTVTATFTQNTYTLTVTILGSGSVDLNDSGPYHYGDIVGLTANPAAGWSFNHWNGDLIGSVNPTTILIDSNKAVTATFTQDTYTLTISTVGSGVVNLNNSGPYYYGDVVELTAVPATGWSFSGWSGDLSGSNNAASITMTGDRSVTATFTQDHYTLTVNVVGGGSVTKDPDQATYAYGDSVRLTAIPALGWSFASWSGDLSGSTNPETIIITNSVSITAHFSQNQYTLTVNIEGSGSVDKVPDQATYDYGTLVTLTAVANAGWSFGGWNGDATGSLNPVSVIINGTTSVTATFTQNTYRITVTQGANGVISPETIDVEYGSDKAFTITPDNGYHIFDVVVDDIPQGAVSSYLFSNVVANHTISASFAIDVYKPFSVVSNSTISELAFNSTSQVLSFTAGGPSGTTGFSNVTISKTLIADVSGLEVYLDGTKTGYVVSDLTTSWLIYITYQHSTHKIVVNFALPPGARADYVSYIALVAILGLIVAFVLTVFAKRRGKSSQSEARARS